MDTNYFVAHTASYSKRLEILRSAVDNYSSLFDLWLVYLNDIEKVPDFLKKDNIRVVLGKDALGDIKDSAKVYLASSGEVKGTFFILDDDLILPPDFTDRMNEALNRFDRRAVVGTYGGTFGAFPIENYNKDRFYLGTHTSSVTDYLKVQWIGSGIIAYDPAVFKIDMSDAPEYNMTDVWFSIRAWKSRIPLILVPHKKNWVSFNQASLDTPSIFETTTKPKGDYIASVINKNQTICPETPDAVKAVRKQMNETSKYNNANSKLQYRFKKIISENKMKSGKQLAVNSLKSTYHGKKMLKIISRLRTTLSHFSNLVQMSISQNRESGVAKFIYRGKSFFISAPEGDHLLKSIRSAKTFYEMDLLEAIEKMKLGGTYVDVGGNIGNHSLYFSTCCSAQRLVTIEPLEKVFWYLVHNVGQQATIPVEYLNCAIGEHSGLASMKVNNPGNLGMTSISSGASTSVRTLDALLEHIENIAFIKIDVEGSELAVLNGAKKVLKRCHPVLAIESSTDAELNDVKEILEPLGYKATERYCYTPTWLWIHESME